MIRPKRINVDALTSCEVEDDLLVFSQQKNALFSLNPSARAVWDLCDGQRTAADICAILAQDLNLPESDLIQDIQLAIQLLTDANLVQEGQSEVASETSTIPVAD